MTSDPEKARQFTVRITADKLDNVFDQTNKSNYNLNSIIVDNHIPSSNKKHEQKYL